MVRPQMVTNLAHIMLDALDSSQEKFSTGELASAMFTLAGHVIDSIIKHSAADDLEENRTSLRIGLLEIQQHLTPTIDKGN